MTLPLKKLLADCFKTFSGRPEDWTVSCPCHLYLRCATERFGIFENNQFALQLGMHASMRDLNARYPFR